MMQINADIFREFSIRGIADQDLADDVVVRIGWATGTFFKKQDADLLVVGRDIRNSSERISAALVEGLLQSGVNVIDIGRVPTPVLNYATDSFQAGGGVMITASHNPPDYNGLKIRGRHTLGGDDLQTIYRLTAEYPQGEISAAGQVRRVDALPEYLKQIKALARIQEFPVTGKPLKIVVDGGNGINGMLVAGLLRDLGCEVIELYCEPDGDFPGRGPDPTAVGATGALAELVRSKKADLGLAYDGDGDRLALVDEQGNTVLGDQIMMILARDMLRDGPAKIVYEILCTQALADEVIALGGEPVMTPSGYAFVHQAMLETGAVLGGELSGHLFFNEPGFRFDDAILGTIKFLNVITQSDVPLSSLVENLPAYYSSPELRIPCPDEIKTAVVTYTKAQFMDDYHVDTLDGARIHFEDGWALVRQSNTQPIMSMRFEARSAAQLEVIQAKVQSLVEAEINRLKNG